MTGKTPPYPLTFRPLLKQTLWGGRRLGGRLGKPLGDESNYAESWEVVDHGEDQSVVEFGDLAGLSLSDLVHDHREWLLGKRANASSLDSFPLLLKYLDCNRVLSVQVHPDDAFGRTLSPPDLGKTEAWYVIEVAEDSLVYAGLKAGVDRASLREAMDAGQTDQVLHSFHPDPGDVVFIPAGTVHALGAGLLIAEIQQSSDTTFRLFDWNRVDAQGNSRPLHIEQSLAVSDFESGPIAPRNFDRKSSGLQKLVACDKFDLQILARGTAEVGGDGQVHLLTVPTGRATLAFDMGEMSLSAGDTVLIPAAMAACQITSAITSNDDAVLVASLPSR